MDHRVAKNFPVILCVMGATLLTGFGLVCLYSALRGSFEIPVNLFRKQAILLALAAVLGLVIACASERWIRRMAYAGLIGSALLLVIVLLPGVGVRVNGAQRWLDFGFVRLQVSEFVKVGFVIGMAHYLNRSQRDRQRFWKGMVIPIGITGIFSALVILEPDYGTAVLYGGVGVTMIFLWGGRLRYLLPIVTVGVILVGALIHQDPVRWKRITSFLDTEANRADGAYQLWQGLHAFGTGGITGVGIGNGRQQLAYLPEAHTDFIFSVLGEELGMMATLSIVVLFLAMFSGIVIIAARSFDSFWFLVTVGCGSFLTLQALFNMGVVTGCLPTKGISLPFISCGGSNLVSAFMMLGSVVCAWRHSNRSLIIHPREL